MNKRKQIFDSPRLSISSIDSIDSQVNCVASKKPSTSVVMTRKPKIYLKVPACDESRTSNIRAAL